jgi:hypothetical protein
MSRPAGGRPVVAAIDGSEGALQAAHLAAGEGAGPVGSPRAATGLARLCSDRLARHRIHVVEALEDLPEVRSWTWNHPDRFGAEENR